MGETDIGKGSENLFSVERVAQGWATLDKQAKQGEQRLEGEKRVKEIRRYVEFEVKLKRNV